jgi:hypothetical protein
VDGNGFPSSLNGDLEKPPVLTGQSVLSAARAAFRRPAGSPIL